MKKMAEKIRPTILASASTHGTDQAVPLTDMVLAHGDSFRGV